MGTCLAFPALRFGVAKQELRKSITTCHCLGRVDVLGAVENMQFVMCGSRHVWGSAKRVILYNLPGRTGTESPR